MFMLAAVVLSTLTTLAVLVATWPATGRRRRPVPATPIVLPVVGVVPRIEEFACFVGYGDRVVLSVAAGAPADVVAGAELVAGWYGFAVRRCPADVAGTEHGTTAATAA